MFSALASHTPIRADPRAVLHSKHLCSKKNLLGSGAAPSPRVATSAATSPQICHRSFGRLHASTLTPASPAFKASAMVGTVNGSLNGALNGSLNGALNGTLNGSVNGGACHHQQSVHLHADVERLLFTPEQISKRVDEVGRKLAEEYADLEPVFLVVLTGAFMFASDLLRAVSPVPAGLRVEFIRASSYGNGSESCGEVTFKSNVDPSVVKGRHVVVVEDIIDSGRTLHCLVGYLDGLGAASVKTVALLDKKERRSVDYNPDYSCFECPNEFVVGYGLDFAEQYRSLPYVGVLKEHLYK